MENRPTNLPVQPTPLVGRETEVVVKVARLYDYAGEFQVELVVPPGTRGLSSLPIAIPSGRDELALSRRRRRRRAYGCT